MTNIIQLPVIAGVEITTDAEGRFNLNAIHRASGEEKKKGPSYWLALESTRALTEELESQSTDTGISVSPLSVRKGGNFQGSFAHELLAVSYAGWISPAFQLKVNQVFIDYRSGKLQQLAIPTTLAEALQLAANIERDRVQALIERDEAIRTKAQIGSSREASAMARASAEARRANKLAEQIGDGRDWKAVKSIYWLGEVFEITRTMYQQVGKKLKAISSELDLEVKDIEDSAYGVIKAYHVDAIDELHTRLLVDSELLAKYRAEKGGASSLVEEVAA